MLIAIAMIVTPALLIGAGQRASATTTRATDDERVLAPAWTAQLPSGIEWCRAVESSTGRRLVLCTRDHQLHVLGARDGAPVHPTAAQAAPGVSLAGAAVDRIYAFDRLNVYCIKTDGARHGAGQYTDGVMWRVGTHTVEGNDDGDPEHLTRLLAAAAAPGGVLVARSDGRITLLSANNGFPHRSWRVGPIASARLFVDGDVAATVGVFSGRAAVLIWRLDRPEAPRACSVGDAPPAWSAMAEGHVIALWPREARVIGRDGATFTVVPDAGARLMAGATSLLKTGARGPGDQRAQCEVWLGQDDGALFQIGLPGGSRRTFAGPGAALFERLAAGSAVIAAVDSERVYLWPRAASGTVGRVMSNRLGERTRTLALTVDGNAAWMVMERAAAPSTGAEGDPRRLCLLARMSAAQSMQEWMLHEATDVRDAIWLDRAVVIVESSTLRGYDLPD